MRHLLNQLPPPPPQPQDKMTCWELCEDCITETVLWACVCFWKQELGWTIVESKVSHEDYRPCGGKHSVSLSFWQSFCVSLSLHSPCWTPSTGITPWRWASTAHCSLASPSMSRERWVACWLVHCKPPLALWKSTIYLIRCLWESVGPFHDQWCLFFPLPIFIL